MDSRDKLLLTLLWSSSIEWCRKSKQTHTTMEFAVNVERFVSRRVVIDVSLWRLPKLVGVTFHGGTGAYIFVSVVSLP